MVNASYELEKRIEALKNNFSTDELIQLFKACKKRRLACLLPQSEDNALTMVEMCAAMSLDDKGIDSDTLFFSEKN